VVADFFGNCSEDAGRNGEIENAHPFFSIIDELLERIPALIGLGIDRDVVEPLAELLNFSLVVFALLQVLLQCVLGKFSIIFMREIAAGSADDTGWFRKLTLHLTVVKGRQELALCEVAGSAEHDAIKGFDWDDLAAHLCSFVLNGWGHT
jgi:hypothetical protein